MHLGCNRWEMWWDFFTWDESGLLRDQILKTVVFLCHSDIKFRNRGQSKRTAYVVDKKRVTKEMCCLQRAVHERQIYVVSRYPANDENHKQIPQGKWCYATHQKAIALSRWNEVRIMPRARCRRKNVAIGQHTRSPSPIATKMHVNVVSFLFLLYCANRSMSMLFLLSRWTLRRWHGFQIDVMRPCSQTLPLVRID